MKVEWTTIDHAALVKKAAASLSTRPRPFLKWAGSKRLLLPQIVPHLPRHYRRYYEPFLGGASLFFLLEPRFASLSDTCDELIDVYRAVRDNARAVLRYLTPLEVDRETFYHIRGARSAGRFKKAAEFIYLNKTCWNGLYRVNQQGQFNVPFGRPSSRSLEALVDGENLQACSKALSGSGVSLFRRDFARAVERAGRGDLVFFDPPYVTGHRNNGFIDYNEVLFSWDDQERLAKLARRLTARGCHVLITNADHGAITGMYDGFRRIQVLRHSTIAGDARKRGVSTELLLLGTGTG